MRHHRITISLVAAALTVGIVATPAIAAPTTPADNSLPTLTAAQIAQLRHHVDDINNAANNGKMSTYGGHPAVHATDFGPWITSQGWETLDFLAESSCPNVAQLFQAKAQKKHMSEDQARADFKKSKSTGEVSYLSFTPTTMTEMGRNHTILGKGEYTLAKRLHVGDNEIYFFENVLKAQAGNRHWFVLIPPGADKDKQGNTIARHIHYVLSDSPLAIVAAMVKKQMPTMIEANATWKAKVAFLKLALSY